MVSWDIEKYERPPPSQNVRLRTFRSFWQYAIAAYTSAKFVRFYYTTSACENGRKAGGLHKTFRVFLDNLVYRSDYPIRWISVEFD